MRLLAFFLAGAAIAIVVGVLITVVIDDHPAPKSLVASCQHTKRTIVVNFEPNSRYRQILDHIWFATAHGQPDVLHIARNEATANRAASLRGVLVKKGFDRDEYPPAFSDEGGKGADVRYVDPTVNRSAGAVMGNKLEPFCNGTKFRFEHKPGPK